MKAKRMITHKNSGDNTSEQLDAHETDATTDAGSKSPHSANTGDENKSNKSPKKDASKELPQNSSPVCFAEDPEVRDEYRTE